MEITIHLPCPLALTPSVPLSHFWERGRQDKRFRLFPALLILHWEQRLGDEGLAWMLD